MSRLIKIALAISLSAVLLALGVAPANAQDPDAPSIAEVATEDGRFGTLLLALDAAGLADMFGDCAGGPYTVLAPTDDAFNATIAETGIDAGTLLADTDLLASILTYHVVEGAAASDVVVTLDGQEAPTVQGESIGIVVSGDTISITSGNPTAVNVVVPDVQACNGIIHAVDGVLIPPSVAEALGLAAAEEEATEEEAAEEEAEAAEEEATEEEAAEETTEAAELAETGVNTYALAVLAGALLIAGAMLVSGSRRLRTLR